MNVEMAHELLTYNTWANNRVLGAVGRIDSGQFTRTLGGSYPSIQSTLTHMLWVEWLWVERWQGHSPKDLFAPQDFPAVSDIVRHWGQIQATQETLLRSLTSEDLQRVIRYLWRMLHHVFNHSTYHRGQVTNMLRLLDAEPAATDFLEWWDEGR
jgi:uncharacterized damage-inducible protein DinB